MERTTHFVPRWLARLGGLLRGAGRGAHWVLLVSLLGATVTLTIIAVRSAVQRAPEPARCAMTEVNWTSPDSSQYCLACHKDVARAAAGLDVEQGHPQNVALSATQLDAVTRLGTVVGTGGTLICMTCHTTASGPQAHPYMLADELAGSRLCAQCHPEQFTQAQSPHDLRHSAPTERNRLSQTAGDGGPCSACHLAHHYARTFEPCDLDPGGRCVTCHDMRACAAERVLTRADHPESHCTACHNPHDNRCGNFLNETEGVICLTCHATYSGGVAAGMHPLGPLGRSAAAALVAAGATDASEVTCRSCHETHTSIDQPLLRMSRESNEMCLVCHNDKRPGLAGAGCETRHAAEPILNSTGRSTVAFWGTSRASDGRLLCISCHEVHDATPGSGLLAFRPSSDETCTSCHVDQAAVIGSAHDLRSGRPNEANLHGVTAAAGGACSACHLGHGPARALAPGPGDATGVCVTCHQADRCASSVEAGAFPHPGTTCTDCHDPHARGQPNFLARSDGEVCTTCHAEQGGLVGGPHDYALNSSKWPEASQRVGGTCLPCHRAHGERFDSQRYGVADRDSFHDDACLTCHPGAGWDAKTPTTILHPHQISPDQDIVSLALVPKDAAGNLRMGCRTCHDPHGGGTPVHLARVTASEATDNLCLHCHGDKRQILMTGHSAERLAKLGFDVDSCKPCHAMHAEPKDAWGTLLSPRFLGKDATQRNHDGEAFVPCLTCHHAGGPAPLRDVFTHPPVQVTSILSVNSPGYLPLFNAAGVEDPFGQVVCRTCHLAHGWKAADDARAASETPSPEEQRAKRYQLRPFTPPNVCTTCHGVDALRRFLYFHDPQRRAGPAAAR